MQTMTGTATRDMFISLVHLNLDETETSDMQKPEETTINMGKPITVPVLIPVEHKATPSCINKPFIVNGECFEVTAMSFCTPYGAVFTDNLDGIDVGKIGSSLGTHPLFPQGASIVFIQMLDRKSLNARVWQRGEGEVAFSPEAACVAGTAAMMLQKTPWYEVDVNMGKTFRVNWNRSEGDVTITGPSRWMRK